MRAFAITAFSNLRRFAADEAGATAIEYALIASGISVVIVATAKSLGVTVSDMFQSLISLW